jgi:hypothetical protein
MRTGLDFSEVYARVASAVLENRNDDAQSGLKEVPGWRAPLHPIVTSFAVSCAMQLATFRQDSFTCRYCGRRTVFLPVLRLLAMPFGTIFPYHPRWKMTGCHLGFWRDVASCDHKVPIARLGSSEPSNLVTACYMCNSMKQNWLIEELGWELLPSTSTAWDGLASCYPALLRRLQPEWLEARKTYFRDWLRVVDSSSSAK